EGSAALRGRGRVLRRRDCRAPEVRGARAGAGADDAEGEGHLPGEPSAIGRRPRLPRRPFSEKGRRALLDRLEPVPEPLQPLDPKSSFGRAGSGNTRDQTSTVYEAQIPRGYLGWGNVSTLGLSLAGAIGAKLAFPNRQCVHVTGDAGVCYMMGNFEAVARSKIGITTVHINNGGYSGYGQGFWGPGHDPYTWKVSDHGSACMASMARAVGFHGED